MTLPPRGGSSLEMPLPVAALRLVVRLVGCRWRVFCRGRGHAHHERVVSGAAVPDLVTVLPPYPPLSRPKRSFLPRIAIILAFTIIATR